MMKRTKKLAAILMALVMVVGLLPTFANPAKTITPLKTINGAVTITSPSHNATLARGSAHTLRATVSGMSNVSGQQYSHTNVYVKRGSWDSTNSTVVASWSNIPGNIGSTGERIITVSWSTTSTTATGTYYIVFVAYDQRKSDSNRIVEYHTITLTKAPGADVSAPTVSGVPTSSSITVNSVTLSPNTGQSAQYAISTSTSTPSSWQSGRTFSSLNPNTTYYVFARSTENTTYNAGTAKRSNPGIKTAMGTGLTGADVSGVPTVGGTPTSTSITFNSVNIPFNPGNQTVEYAISTSTLTPSSGWQSSRTFSGLNPNTTYYVFARSAANANYNAGTAQRSTGITTASQGTWTESSRKEVRWTTKDVNVYKDLELKTFDKTVKRGTGVKVDSVWTHSDGRRHARLLADSGGWLYMDTTDSLSETYTTSHNEQRWIDHENDRMLYADAALTPGREAGIISKGTPVTFLEKIEYPKKDGSYKTYFHAKIKWKNMIAYINANHLRYVAPPPISNSFIWPVPAYLNKVYSDFGSKYGGPHTGRPNHGGIDISPQAGRDYEIVASGSGTVTVHETGCTHIKSCPCGGGFGNWVSIQHSNGHATIYAHLKHGSIVVKNGAISKGQKIGLMGTSGRSSGLHLHFEVRKPNVNSSSTKVDPLRFLGMRGVGGPDFDLEILDNLPMDNHRSPIRLSKPTKLKLIAKKLTWKNVVNNNGYTLKIMYGKKTVVTTNIKKNKKSHTFTKTQLKKLKRGKKYHVTLVAKGTGNFKNSTTAKSKKVRMKK
ncbi:MAG: M23 family metallopeptidase [Oscillospiraceae bacterium]|nr:M23 family metallopeptidase [Oscillospiraceae bacterium]